MEQLLEITKPLQFSLVSENVPKLPVVNSFQVKQHKQTGEIYVSAYNDRKATDEEIRKIVQEFCDVFRIQKSGFYLTTVKNAEMTYFQLLDAINHILSIWDDTKFGKPLPAQIVNFDKRKENVIFTRDEVLRMSYAMCEKKYPYPECKDHYNRCKDYYFDFLKDSIGRVLRDKDGYALFCLSENGEKEKEELFSHINDERK